VRERERERCRTKPSILLLPPFFNNKHIIQGDYVVLASEPLCICGCDVAAPQQVRRGKDQNLADIFKSFEKQFSPKEWAAIKAHSPDEAAMERAFRQHWSLKEAYVKATGLGLALDLGSIAFTITVDGNNNNNTNAATVEYGGKQQTDWAFHLHELGRGHWVSVARAPLSVVVDAWGVSFFVFVGNDNDIGVERESERRMTDTHRFLLVAGI
jgi:4'-phosphopantetheinyl transferase